MSNDHTDVLFERINDENFSVSRCIGADFSFFPESTSGAQPWYKSWGTSVPISGRYSVVTTTIGHRFRDVTTFTLYVTSCDLKKSFIFEQKVEITF